MRDAPLLPFLGPEPWRVAVINPTGRYARSQVAGLISAGSNVVGGVALGRGGESLDGLPLFDTVHELPNANVALIYTPPEGFRDAVSECARAHIRTIIGVAEHVPVHDALAVTNLARAQDCWLIGPNTLGLYVPGRGLLGSIAPSFCMPGRVALIARSGTVTLAIARELTAAGIGQSLAAHIGGDAVIGRNPDEYLAALVRHEGTDAIFYCGEIGGDKEYALAEAAGSCPKPVVAMVIGRHAPAEKRMGHAGALVGSAREGAEAKLTALAAGGCRVVRSSSEAMAILCELGMAGSSSAK
ncbi:MAG: succinate--CoA ligase subunit alpha [Xanthobacteraceae bacterium]